MNELKACPFCGENVDVYKMTRLLGHDHPGFVRCDCVEGVSVARWNDRPIEDELNAKIAQLEAENDRLASLLHDINSQLEIATDLGDKRWQALNDIYLNGEKHNANWCKRKAQEGLGIR